MFVVSRSRLACAGVALAWTLLVEPNAARGAAYYNLGAFWKGHAAAPSCSTISFVQVAPATSGGSNGSNVQGGTASQTLTVTAGNLLVAVVSGFGNSLQATFSVSDNSGTNVWYAGPAQFNSTDIAQTQIFYALGAAGGSTTVTATQLPFAGVYTSLIVFEYSGVATSNAVDASSEDIAPSAGSNAADAGTLTPTSNCNELVLASFVDGSNDFNASSGWTAQAHDPWAEILVEDSTPALTTPGSPVSATATDTDPSPSTNWAAAQIAFRAAGSNSPALPAKIAITSVQQTINNTWQCSGAVTVQAQSAASLPVNVPTPVSISLSGAGLSYFADPVCQVPITSTTILAGASSQTFYFVGSTTGSPSITATAGIGSATQTENVTNLDPFTWTGGGGCDGNWSTGGCWRGGSAPGLSDTAHFDTNCTTQCTAALSADTTIGALAMHPGSGDTVTVGLHNLTLSTGDLTISGGTFNSGTASVSVYGNVSISGGTVHLTGVVSLQKSYAFTGGTLTTTGSTLVLADSGIGWGDSWGITPGAAVYNNVTIQDNGSNASVTRFFAAGSTMTVQGTLTFDTTSNVTFLMGGTIVAKGDVMLLDLGCAGNTVLELEGSTNQAVDASGTSMGWLPALTIASTGGTVTFKGEVVVANDYSYSSGTVDFATNAATLAFNDTGSGCSLNWSITPGTINYYNVSFVDLGNCGNTTRTLAAGSTMNVTGTLTLGGQDQYGILSGGTIAAKGAVTLTGYGYAGNTVVEIAGSTSQLIDATAATTASLPALTIASTGGTVTFKGSPTVANNYVYTSGSVDFTTYNATLVFDDVGPNCNLSWTITPGTISYNNVSFVDYSGCGGTTRTLDAGSTMAVNGVLTLGSQNETGYLQGGTISAKGNITLSNYGYAGNTVLTIAGSTSQTVDASSTGNGSIPGLTISSTGGTVTFHGNPMVADNYVYSSGAVNFSAFNATLVFNDTGNGCNLVHTITPGTITYQNVAFNDYSGCGATKRVFDAGSTMTVAGNLALESQNTNGVLMQGSISVGGDVTIPLHTSAPYFGYDGSTVIILAGSKSQLVDVSAANTDPSGLGPTLPGLAIASTSGTVTFKGTPTVWGDFTYTSGTVDFTTNNVTLIFNDWGDQTWGLTHSLTPGTVSYNNVTFMDSEGAVRNLTGTMNVGGNLVLGAEDISSTLNGGTISAAKNVSIQNEGYSGTTGLTFSGIAPATLSVTGAPAVLGGAINVNKLGGSVTMSTDVSFNTTGQAMTVTSGTVLMSGHNLTVNANLTVSAGATITKGGGTLTYGSLTNNGTIN